MRHPTSVLLATLLILVCGASAQAQEVTLGSANATYPRMVDSTKIDPNTYVFGHPSSVRTSAGHANHEHPAFAMRAASNEIDVNAFILRHPTGAGPAPVETAGSQVATNH